MRTHLRFLVLVVLALTATPPASAAPKAPSSRAPRSRVSFEAPVEGQVVDPFRAPPTPYAAGNRGLEYATAPGSTVRAAAAGVVTFAGQVGDVLNVVVLHADAIRTTYSKLASVGVRPGEHVDAGAVIGTSGPALHFGARAGRAYVDPAVLLAPAPGRPRLVPVKP